MHGPPCPSSSAAWGWWSHLSEREAFNNLLIKNLFYNNFIWSVICKNIKSLCYTPETNTILSINYTSIKKKYLFGTLHEQKINACKLRHWNVGVEGLRIVCTTLTNNPANSCLELQTWISKYLLSTYIKHNIFRTETIILDSKLIFLIFNHHPLYLPT